MKMTVLGRRSMGKDSALSARKACALALLLVLCCAVTAAVSGCGKAGKKGAAKNDIGASEQAGNKDGNQNGNGSGNQNGNGSGDQNGSGNLGDPAGTPQVDAKTKAREEATTLARQAYESTGRADVYRLPIATPAAGTSVFCCATAGEYAMFSVTEGFDRYELGEGELKYGYVLARPLVSKEIKRLELGYSAGMLALFKDGSFLLDDWKNQIAYLYDNTMTEVRSYPYDKELSLGYFCGETAEAWCISAVSTEREPKCLFIPKAGGQAYAGNQPDGLDRSQVTVKYPFGWDNMTESSLPATWYLHGVDDVEGGVAFAKSRLRESLGCTSETTMCGVGMYYPDDEKEYREFRLYDLDTKKVSAALSEVDLPDMQLRVETILDDTALILYATKPDESGEILLWIPEGEGTPIASWGDLSKEESLAYLKRAVDELAAEGIVITPDLLAGSSAGSTADNGSTIVENNAASNQASTIAPDFYTTSFEEFLYEIDFVNKFALAKRQQPDLFPAGMTVHPENMRNNADGHYAFAAHVMSKFYVQEHGEAREQALYRYVDALRAGEEWFDCPDENTMWWLHGRIGHFFFPVEEPYTYPGLFKDGKGQIVYAASKEEFLTKEREFEARVLGIINDAVGDDYTDFEKALALYEFLTEYCTYDYEMLEHSLEWMDRQGGYRALIEKKGICNEFACLYQYLLLQVGVDAEESGGPSLTYGQDSHAWVYLTIDGKGYLVDPTWGETSVREPSLQYFLFTDEKREKRDGFNSKKFDVAGVSDGRARDKYDFRAVSTRYEGLWDGFYVAMDRTAKCVYYLDSDGIMHSFNYGE